MRVDEFDFQLPPELIAQDPAPDRTAARLLRLSRESGAVAHHAVADLPDLLDPGDLLVVNDTRVFPARLLGHRVPSGGAVECLLISRADDSPPSPDVQDWHALMHPGQKLKVGARVAFEQGAIAIDGELIGRSDFGRRLVRFTLRPGSGVAGIEQAIDAIGHVPLPPYIHRDDSAGDRERYQTVFATHRGSVAAPTAGLHFTEDLLDRLRARGVEIQRLTLHVGYGTFQPVRVDDVEQHRLEPERYEIGPDAAASVNRALDERRRVIAVGTTTTRTLEAVAKANGGRLVPGRGATDLFIFPGFKFQVLGGLVTNFHLPRSSLLMLVSAFAGRERVLHAYADAVANRYRFYSYGDAMLIL